MKKGDLIRFTGFVEVVSVEDEDLAVGTMGILLTDLEVDKAVPHTHFASVRLLVGDDTIRLFTSEMEVVDDDTN